MASFGSGVLLCSNGSRKMYCSSAEQTAKKTPVAIEEVVFYEYFIPETTKKNNKKNAESRDLYNKRLMPSILGVSTLSPAL